jgi:hypothetical protein
MKRKRKYIKLREQLAAALSMLLPQVQRDELRSKKAPAKTVIALFSPDHSVLHALGGSDRWWNLTPMLREPHKEKSRNDTSTVAKVRRIDAKWNDFTRRLLSPAKRSPAKRSLGKATRNHWPKRNLRSRSDWPKRKFANR